MSRSLSGLFSRAGYLGLLANRHLSSLALVGNLEVYLPFRMKRIPLKYIPIAGTYRILRGLKAVLLLFRLLDRGPHPKMLSHYPLRMKRTVPVGFL